MTDARLPSTASPERPAVSHREWIGGAVMTLLSHYWQDRDRDELVADAALADWMDDLEPFPRSVVQAAIREWRQTSERRPTPAALRRLCLKHMPRPVALPFVPPQRPRCSVEQARKNQRAIAEHWPDLAWPPQQEKPA